MRCIAVGADSSQLRQFIEAFGVRLLALIDQGSTVYDQYRVPNPTAPYPQDYIIDQQGIVRYWNDAYDPQAVMRTIDRLLQTGITDSPGHYANRFDSVSCPRPTLTVLPNPGTGPLTFTIPAAYRSPRSAISIIDCTGRCRAQLVPDAAGQACWPDPAGPGVYVARVQTRSGALARSFALLP